MNKLKRRHWALFSDGAGAGKSTFLGSNVRRPAIVVDTDGRFGAVAPLADGEIIYPKQFIDPLTLVEELMVLVVEKEAKTVVFDSLTKLYSVHARIGYMRARAGRSKNKASEHIDKANAMSVARDIAVFGTDIFYCYHRTHGIDGMGNSEVRDMISGVEMARLATSINVSLEFFRKKDRFGITVVEARDFGGRPANTGFTLYDEPGNYWAGGAERLERLIYSSFHSRDEAIKWGAKSLGLLPEEAESEYERVKDVVSPETKPEMWIAWVQHVDDLVKDKTEDKTEDKNSPASAPQEQPAAEIQVEDTEPAYETDLDKDTLRAGLNTPDATIGKVVYAAATVKDDLTSVVDYLLRLKEYPFTDSQQAVIEAGKFKIIMDQKLKGTTAQEMYDWLTKPKALVPEEELL